MSDEGTPMATAATTGPATQPGPIPNVPRRGVASWVMFEWAAQPFYTLIVTFLFGPYFVNVVVGDKAAGQAMWGNAAALAGILIAVGSPILGAVADVRGQRKPWLAIFVVIMAACMAALWFAVPGAKGGTLWLVLAAFIIASAVAEFAVVFFNAMMPTLVPRDQLGKLSGISWAVGYLGGLFALILMAGFIAIDASTGKTLFGFAPVINLNAALHESDRLVGPLCALWLIIFAIPMFLFTPDAPRNVAAGTVRDGLKSFWQTVKDLPQHPEILVFLLARMSFSDGMSAIFVFGGIYGAGVFDWGLREQGMFGIIVVLVGAIGAFLGGFVDDRIGAKRVIMGALLVVIISAIGILSVDKTHVFFTQVVAVKVPGSAPFSSTGEQVFLMFAILLGLVSAPVQASSRSLIARIAPADKITQFFGLFAFSGKATAFAAPLLVGVVTAASGDQRIGMASILIFLILGLILMAFVRERR
jgi:MFS transporter, UMF1 family